MMFSYEPYKISIAPIGKTHWIFGLSLLYLIHGCSDWRCGSRGKKMASFTLNIGGEIVEELHGITKDQCLNNLWTKYRCEHGPMSGDKPASLADLLDRMSDAYGEDCSLDIEE